MALRAVNLSTARIQRIQMFMCAHVLVELMIEIAVRDIRLLMA